jgi:phosphoglycolate phosphatase
MANAKSIVFDLDGTLIDSVPAVAAAINRVLVDEGRQTISVAAAREMVGGGAHDTMLLALKATGGGDKEQAAKLMERYFAAYLDNPAANTMVYPGVVDVLEGFSAEGIAMGICTNKPGMTTMPVLDALGLAQFFSAVLTPADTMFPKPDGRHVLETLDKMGCGTEGAFFVGDSETDVGAANNAGIPVVCVTYGYCHVPFAQLDTLALIDTFWELPKVI